jgi:hypothetical protein
MSHNKIIGNMYLLLMTIMPKTIIEKPPQKEAYKRPTGPIRTVKIRARATLL